MTKGWFLNLFRKSQNDRIKETIKEWIIQIDQTEKLSKYIIALNFNLYEGPYELELIGSATFDESDEDWACNEDFVPHLRRCPSLSIPNDKNWEEVLSMVESILRDLIREMPEIGLFKVQHIAVGFVDGSLSIIK
ncbi:hypothetical protein [Bacteroides cellulosilyticus]|uniref:hypothetical protein n=1 Tax=Bacteroides cellulosilyticus TaxID=246787 RepID=UPI0032EF2D04